MGYPCHLRGKAFHMILFLLKKAFRYEHGKIHILHAGCLESLVQLLLDKLPDRIARRFDHHTALNAGIVNQLRFLYHIGVPLCEILVHGGYCLHQFLVCHFLSPFSFSFIAFFSQKNRRFLIHHSGLLKETCLRDRKTGGTTLINTSADAFTYFSVNAGITLYLWNRHVPSYKAPRPVGLRLHENLPPSVFSLWMRHAAYFSFSLPYQYICIDIRKLFGFCQLILIISSA